MTSHEFSSFLRPSPWDSSDIGVEKFEVSLLLPVLIQNKKNLKNDYLVPELDPSQHDFLDKWASFLSPPPDTSGNAASLWKPIDNGYPRHAGVDREPSYSEFCYFHPFVRNFLYLTRGDIREHFKRKTNRPGGNANAIPGSLDDMIASATNRNLRILMRDDVDAIVIEVKELVAHFKVESCWLYLFDTQVAMLELQLRHTHTFHEGSQLSQLNLRQVMTLQDSIRQVYAPYWSVYHDHERPERIQHNSAHVPDRISLLTTQGETITSSFGNFSTDASLNPQNVKAQTIKKVGAKNCSDVDSIHSKAVEDHLQNVRQHREPHTVKVWEELLKPLVPTQLGLKEQEKQGIAKDLEVVEELKRNAPLCFEHIRDERAMLISYLGIANDSVRHISTGDWLRLAFVDEPGESQCFPYSPLAFGDPDDPLAGYSYDRFWHPTGDAPAQPYQTTRWLCSGYGFSAVGNASDRFFFADDHAGALCHFRNHYFALSLISQFHHASLLMYKHRLAEAADNMLSEDGNCHAHSNGARRLREIDFRAQAEELAKEIMRFRTLYWFSEVSNQIQGRELFAMFRKHLNLEQLFSEVTGDIEASVSLLRQWDAEDQSRAAQTLGLVAAAIAVLAPVLGSLSDLIKLNWFLVLGLSLFLTAAYLPILRIPNSWLNNVSASGWAKRKTSALRWLVRRDWFRLGASFLALIVSSVFFYHGWHEGKHIAEKRKSDLRTSIESDRNRTGKIPGEAGVEPNIGQLPRVPMDTTENSGRGLNGASPRETIVSSENQESNSDTNSTGANANPLDLAPQNPNSGREPPNQQSPSGQAATSLETTSPEP